MGRRKIFVERLAEKLPKFEERHESTQSLNSMNSK
jgi:hypothetical protein